MNRVSAILLIASLAACAKQAPPVVITMCPQPSTESLAVPDPLPSVPDLSIDPDITIGTLSSIIARDLATYENETARRRALIEHGVDRCGWTR